MRSGRDKTVINYSVLSQCPALTKTCAVDCYGFFHGFSLFTTVVSSQNAFGLETKRVDEVMKVQNQGHEL
jgi:hypothetical protein